MTRRAGLICRVAAGFLLAFALTSLLHPRVVQAQASPAAAPAALNDPTGATTGTAKDVAVKDPKNPTLGEVMDTVGHNRIALNVAISNSNQRGLGCRHWYEQGRAGGDRPKRR